MEQEQPINLAPIITPEVLAENDKKQEEWKRLIRIPDFLLSGRSAWQKRDAILTNDLIQTVTVLENQLTGEKDAATADLIAETLIRKRDELAEIYFRSGDFAFATAVAATPARKELYNEYLIAEARHDAERCEHFGRDDFVERYPVKTKSKGDFAAIVRCGKCGFRNIRNLTPVERGKLNYGNNS